MHWRAWLSGGLSWILFIQSSLSVLPARALVTSSGPSPGVPGVEAPVPGDVDPFFLGSQSWRAGSSSADTASVRIEIAEADLALQVDQPLVQLGQAADWIFFAPRARSALDEPGSQGLYFIRAFEFYQSARTRTTVPFFYLPLPAKESEYTVAAGRRPELLELPEQEAILIRDTQGVTFAIPTSDVAGYEKNETAVLHIASLSRLQQTTRWLDSAEGQRALVPFREKLWSTLLNAARSAQGISSLEQLEVDPISEMRAFLPAELRQEKLPAGSTRLHGILPTFRHLPREVKSTFPDWSLFPLAHAVDVPSASTLDLAAHAAMVVANCSLSYAAAVLLKHTILKQRVGRVQSSVLSSAMQQVTTSVDDLLALIPTYGLSTKQQKKAVSILDQIESKMVKLRQTRDAQVRRILERNERTESDMREFLHAWSVMEEKLADIRRVLTSTPASAGGSADVDAALHRDRAFALLKALPKDLEKAAGVGREFKTTVGIFGHVLTTLMQIPSVWSTHTIRYVLDRVGVAEHSKIRWVFENTFGWAQRTSDRTPINSRTVKLGTGVENIVDQANVAVELFVFFPLFSHWASAVVPSTWLQDRIASTYGTNESGMTRYRLTTLGVNFVLGTASGAYSVAHTQQELVMQTAGREVRREFHDRGLDIDSGENQIKMQELIQKRVRASLSHSGFPTEEEFFFDANSIYTRLLEGSGYTLPSGRKGGDHAQARPGRILGVLKDAIERARWRDDAVVQSGLEEIARDFSFAHLLGEAFQAIATPQEFKQRYQAAGRAYQQARRDLVALTLPYQVTDLNGVEEVVAPRFRGDAQAVARAWELVRETWQQAMDPSRGKTERLEKADHNDPAVILEERAEFEREMNPELRLGTFGRWQLRRALEKAERAAAHNSELWDSVFRTELVRAMGLDVDTAAGRESDTEIEAFLTTIRQTAESAWNERLKRPDFLEYYSKLSPLTQRRLRGLYQAEVYADAYADQTINRKRVGALSSAQPGVLKKFREKGWVKKSRALTTLARMFESGFSNTRYQLGFWPKVARSIPFVDDSFVQGPTRSLRRFPIAFSVGMLWNYMIWGSSYHPSMFVLNFTMAAVTMHGPWFTALRMMDNIGFQQGKKALHMAFLTTIGSWLTMWGMWITPLVAPLIVPRLEPVDRVFEKLNYVVRKEDPVTHETRFEVRPHPGVELCRKLLMPAVNYFTDPEETQAPQKPAALPPGAVEMK